MAEGGANNSYLQDAMDWNSKPSQNMVYYQLQVNAVVSKSNNGTCTAPRNYIPQTTHAKSCMVRVNQDDETQPSWVSANSYDSSLLRLQEMSTSSGAQAPVLWYGLFGWTVLILLCLLRAYCRRGDADENSPPPTASTPTSTTTIMAPRFLQRALIRTRSFRVFPIRLRSNSHQNQENKDPPAYDEVLSHPDVYPIIKDNLPGSSTAIDMLMDTSPPGGCDAPPSYRAAMEIWRQQNGGTPTRGLPTDRRRVSFSHQQPPIQRRSARRWSEAGWNYGAPTLWNDDSRLQVFSPPWRMNSPSSVFRENLSEIPESQRHSSHRSHSHPAIFTISNEEPPMYSTFNTHQFDQPSTSSSSNWNSNSAIASTSSGLQVNDHGSSRHSACSNSSSHPHCNESITNSSIGIIDNAMPSNSVFPAISPDYSSASHTENHSVDQWWIPDQTVHFGYSSSQDDEYVNIPLNNCSISNESSSLLRNSVLIQQSPYESSSRIDNRTSSNDDVISPVHDYITQIPITINLPLPVVEGDVDPWSSEEVSGFLLQEDELTRNSSRPCTGKSALSRPVTAITIRTLSPLPSEADGDIGSVDIPGLMTTDPHGVEATYHVAPYRQSDSEYEGRQRTSYTNDNEMISIVNASDRQSVNYTM